MVQEAFRMEVDISRAMNRFQKTLPNLTREKILRAMFQFADDLDAAVIANIESDFGTEHRGEQGRQPHTPMWESILTTVVQEGDLIIASVGYDLAVSPYARIQELGGVIRGVDIRPRSANMLAIPSATFRSASMGEASDSEFVYAFGTPDRGEFEIIGRHYIQKAVAAMAKKFNNDLERAVAEAASESEYQ